MVQILNNHHLGTKARIDRTHLKSYHARADHHQLFRNAPQRQSPGRGHDNFLVNLNIGQACGFRACCNHNMFGLINRTAHFNLPRRGHLGPAFDPCDLILFQQKFYAFGVLAHHIVLIGLHFGPINFRRGTHQTHFFEIHLSIMQSVGRVQQRL